MKYYIQTDDGVLSEIWITEDKKLGRGATATVYSVLHDGKSLAAKIYHKDRTFDSEKIRAMLENPPDCAEVIHNGQDYPQIAWPLAIIENDDGDEVGFLLPLVDTQESFTLDHYYDQGLFKKLNSHDESALSYKLEIARNLSKIVAELHSHEHYFIDCKPQNIRVFKRNHVVTLIDCDGFSINGQEKRFPAELLSTDYISPEAQRELTSPTLLSEDQDRYALAVILFQLLNRGTHPFQGIITDPDITCSTNDEKAALGLYPYGTIRNFQIKPRPQSTHHLWDSETRRLFDQAFTAKEPGMRPSAQQWANHFESLLITKTLVRCDKFPNDLAHIRFKDMLCPACYLNSLQTFTPPPPIKRHEQTRSFNQSQPAPYTNTSSQASSGNGFWWVISALAIIFLLIIFNSDKKSNSTYSPPINTSPDTNSSPQVIDPTPTPNLPSTKEESSINQYISLFASNSRAIGYSIGNTSQSKANSDGYQQCNKQISDKKDICVLVLSGKGQCLAISRSNDGALGASIGMNPISTATEAQNACKNNGGKNCPYPTETIFCSN